MEFDTDKKFCSIILDVIASHGVKEIVCSPGSRNTPLLLAASAREHLKKHFVVDERSAAFMALGIAIVSQKPVVLLCTSGTALLNYAPAVAEAYYQGIPLIVISADRPEQWIDQDDSQTLRQDEALANFVKKSFSLPSHGDNNPELQWYAARIANDAMSVALNGKKGPVHINVHIGEPLGRTTQELHHFRYNSRMIEADSIGNKEFIRKLASEFINSKVLIVAGFMQPDSRLQKAIASISLFPNVVVMAETLSNLHLGEKDYSIDSTLTAFPENTLDKYAPDLIISLGGALISRKLKEYLRRNCIDRGHICLQWNLGRSRTLVDCFKIGPLRIEVEPARFIKNLVASASKMKINERCFKFKNDWENLRIKAAIAKNAFMSTIPWSELKAFEIILKNLPPSANLFLSNGTSVRYAQIISHKLPHAEYCNRGVSGIDGSTSTSMGGALNYKGLTLLITGDLSMSYDIGALALRNIPDRFKIIVIDNQGGGIFRFIPSTSSLNEREEYFCMPPNLPLKDLARGYSFNYYEVTDKNSLETSLSEFFNDDKKAIMRVICDGFLSAEILKSYMSKKAIDN